MSAGHCPKFFMIGGTGDGKSALADALRDPRRSEAPPTGVPDDDQEGVTRRITAYTCKLINGRDAKILDGPGSGHFNPIRLMKLYEEPNHRGPYDCLLVVMKVTDQRIALQAQVATAMIKTKIVHPTGNLFDSVILVGTHGDVATQSMKDTFKSRTTKRFFEKLGAPDSYIGKSAIVGGDGRSTYQLGDLPDMLAQMAGHLEVQTSEATTDDYCDELGRIFGHDAGTTRRLKDQVRRLEAYKKEKEKPGFWDEAGPYLAKFFTPTRDSTPPDEPEPFFWPTGVFS